MPTITDYLNNLKKDKDNLVSNLNAKGISAENSETFTSLVPKVLEIKTEIDTSDATATASDILNNKTAYVGGNKVTGNIPTKSEETYIPTTTDQTILQGRYLSGNQTIKGDVNLTSSNIKAGSTIFGVTGTYDPFIYELPFNTINANSISDVYTSLGDTSMLLVEGDEWRSLNNIKTHSEELAGTNLFTPRWVYKDTGLTYYGIYLDSPVSSDYWDINNKKLSIVEKLPIELKGTHLFVRFRAEAIADGNSITLKFDLVSADNFTDFMTKFSNNQISYTVNKEFKPAYSGDLQLFEFTEITPGKYFLVVTAPLGNNSSGGCTGFTIDSIGVLNA